MSFVRRPAALAVAVLAALAVGLPAHAATTEVRSPSGLYSGNVKATLIAPLQIAGGALLVCSSSALSGSVDSDGDPLGIASASFGGCSGLSSSVSAQSLPWNGRIAYSPVLPGRDGLVGLTGFSLQAVVLGSDCVYKGDITANMYNGANPSRPVPAAGEAQIDLTGVTVPKVKGPFFCPANAAIVQGAYALTGESSTSPGTYDVPLAVSGTYP